MIGNERQLVRARAKLAEVEIAIRACEDAGTESLRRLAGNIREEISEFERIVAGEEIEFEIDSLDVIPGALIKARLVRGMNQRQLADSIGVSEQMVQKDESGGYENASLSRLADVAEYLGYSLHGWFAPADRFALAIKATHTLGCSCQIEYLEPNKRFSDTDSQAIPVRLDTRGT